MATTAPARRKRRHTDPDTAEDLRLLAGLPDGARRTRVRRRVIATWLPMAHRLAHRLRDRGESLDDLRQVAALGLVKAVDRYDPRRADAFEAFAVPTITGELKKHFRDCTWDVHVPRRAQEARTKVRTAVRELSTTLDGRSPTVAQLAERTGLGQEDVLLGLDALETYRSLSLDAALGPDGDSDDHTLKDILGSTETGFARIDRREAVKPALARLPERERHILYLRFFDDMTQSAIAAETGLSQMHVSRLLSRSLARIRAEVAPAAADDVRAAA
ncbi:RNA polymerase subunit sigma [Streptomyces sp. CB02923]|uniref:SigB/SigF/SigG family RNA polymerase sigma factor n=1 Tax=Streptomyces sp. CB02923 TaxID=1718985 RepID=UPI000939E2DB|nr:SigB/SigF/SigG family RNA polymerase sigma factor [Streptomyces sp. CB02923]OKH99055.1 RNA polymerase subunit sigma [Streptomyces sp. CB02923]